MSPGKEKSYSNVIHRTAAINTCEEPYSLGVLGLSDTHHLSKPDDVVLENLKANYLKMKTDIMRQVLFGKKDQANTKTIKLGALVGWKIW